MENLTQDQVADIIADNISKIYPKFKGKEIDIKFVWNSSIGEVEVLIREAQD